MKISISTHRGGPVTYVDVSRLPLPRPVGDWQPVAPPWWQTWVLLILIILGVTAVACVAALRALGAI